MTISHLNNIIFEFHSQGNESLPVLSHGSERGTGFTHGTKARPVFYSKVGQVSGDAAKCTYTALKLRNSPQRYINLIVNMYVSTCAVKPC